MRTLVLCGTLALAVSVACGQTPERINSGEIIASAVKRHDAGNYKEAIALYQKVPRNDTNYAWSRYELALSYYQDSNYAKAIQTCEAALLLPDKEYELQLLITYGSILDDAEQPDRALRVYDSALLKYPASPSLWLNKGIVLLRQKKVDEAEAIFKTLILKDPYYASAHFRLAQCALQKGQSVPCLFSLFTYLMLSPSGPYYKNAVYLLDHIAKGTDDVLQYVDARTSSDDVFGAAEQIVLSKIALDKAYKTKTSFDDPVIRQLQVVLEKVQYDAAEKNFWMQYYVPLFSAMYKDGQFEPLVYHAFSNIDLEPIQRYVKKNNKEIKAGLSFAATYFNSIRSTRELQATNRKATPTLYHFNDGVYAGMGTMNDKDVLTGKWTFYYPNGNIKSTGSYNTAGDKEGVWNYYYKTGGLSGTDQWSNGKQTGEDIIYSSRGVVTTKAHYRNGELHGDKELFYGIGHLFSKTSYIDGKQNGPYTEYYSNGRKKIETFYKNDELNGPYKSYYKNGPLETEATYSNGKYEGVYKIYYESGQLSKTGAYKSGQLQGETKEYHPHGVLKKLYSYAADLLEGDVLEYSDAGVLIEKVTYKGGKAEGLAEYFDSDGKRFSTFLFDKNILKAARYFDKSGNEISRSERQKGAINLTIFNPEGIKVSNMIYNDAGEKTGSDTYFHTSGKIRETNNYKSGKLHSLSTGYYASGTKEYEIAYADDEKNGLYTSYHLNGKIKAQGWYTAGKLTDTWINYNEKGNIILRTSYLDDDITGYRESYHANGTLDDEEVYTNGWLMAIHQYDTLGNRIHTTEFKNGTGTYKGIHFNGKTSYEGQYVQSEFQGPFKGYYFDGSMSFEKSFDRGLLEGSYTSYHYGGTIATKGAYKNGERTGTWKYYTTEGKLYREETYTDGEINGKQRFYYSNGDLEREIEYKNGERNGALKRYATDGQLSGVFYYKNDVITGYTYADKAGQLLPVKPLPGGNGKVETFYSNGVKSSEMEYTAGVLTGSYKLYHANGKLYYETTEEYGNTNGKLAEYYENGNLKREYLYAYDNEDGPYKEYYENGKVKEQGTYYNGSVHGPVIFYDASGKITSRHHYYYGTLLNISK